MTGSRRPRPTSVSLAELHYSKATARPIRVVLAVAADSSVGAVEDLPAGVRVHTEYPELTKRYFAERGIDADVHLSYGATEAKVPDIADAVVEITETGRALRAAGLKIVDTMLVSHTELIANPAAAADGSRRTAMDELRVLLEGALEARGRVLLKLNVDEASLDGVIALLPALKSPTVSKLFGEDGFAVETVVAKSEINVLIPALRGRGRERDHRAPDREDRPLTPVMQPHAGTVVEFDAERGAAWSRTPAARGLDFHCTRVADGSRSVPGGRDGPLRGRAGGARAMGGGGHRGGRGAVTQLHESARCGAMEAMRRGAAGSKAGPPRYVRRPLASRFGRLAGAGGDLHERHAQLGERLAQRLRALAEAIPEALHECGHGVDRQARLVESHGAALLGREVQHRELPEPDRVVGDEIGHGRARELGADPAQLLVHLGVVDTAVVDPRVVHPRVALDLPGGRRGVGHVVTGCGPVLAGGCPEPAHAGILPPRQHMDLHDAGSGASRLPPGRPRAASGSAHQSPGVVLGESAVADASCVRHPSRPVRPGCDPEPTR